MEGGAFSFLRFNPDPASLAFNNLFADRQADAGSLVLLPRVQPFERKKNPLRIIRPDADSIVLDRKQPDIRLLPGGYMDAGRFRAMKFERIRHQVLEQMLKGAFISVNNRKRVMGEASIFFFKSQLEMFQQVFQYGFRINRNFFQLLRLDSGIFQKILNLACAPRHRSHIP